MLIGLGRSLVLTRFNHSVVCNIESMNSQFCTSILKVKAKK